MSVCSLTQVAKFSKYFTMSASFQVASEVVSLAVLGFVDSISFHKCFGLLAEEKHILVALGKCLAVNLILLLGSVYLHDSVLIPATDLLKSNLDTLSGPSSIANTAFEISRQGLTIIYTSCWLVPIWGLCYLLSLQWYQDIAQELKRRGNHSGKVSSDVKNQIVKECYVFLAWLVLYFFTHGLLTGIPKASSALRNACWMCCMYFGDYPLSKLFLLIAEYATLLSSHLSRGCGFAMQAICYGWYGFDYHWASDGDDYKERFKRVEEHWAYFLGYGLPYVLIVTHTSFLVGFGLYLMLFPFTIILSADSNYCVSHSGTVVPILPLFRLPGLYANNIIKFVLRSTGRANTTFDSKKKV